MHANKISMDKESPPKEARIRGAVRDIVLASTLLVIPMIAMSVGLLTIIYTNRMQNSQSIFQGMNSNTTTSLGFDALYVDYSATRLLTIASWISSVAPLLPSCAMLIISYLSAREILVASKTNNIESLPTPYQLCILLGLNNASITSIWTLLNYVFWDDRNRLPRALRKSIGAYLLSTAIGFGILISDTWLHTVTSTVAVDVFTPFISNNMTPGRALNGTLCNAFGSALWTNGDNVSNVPNGDPCPVFVPGNRQMSLASPAEAFQTYSNRSSRNQVYTFNDAGIDYAFLGMAAPSESVDFRASTHAVGTSCIPISRKCGLWAEARRLIPWSCDNSYHGDLSLIDGEVGRLAKLQFFTDAIFNQSVPIGGSGDGTNNLSIIFHNPFYFGAACLIPENPLSDGSYDAVNSTDPDIVVPVLGGIGWLLNCSVTIYRLNYTWTRGQVSSHSLSPANDSMARVFQAAISGNWVNGYVDSAAIIASFRPVATDIAHDFAGSISQLAVAMAASVMVPIPSDEEQLRSTKLVARVPKAPLFTLIALSCLYAIAGLVLTLYTLIFSRPSELKDVRDRLTAEGLAAASFEPRSISRAAASDIEGLFTEKVKGEHQSRRVGIRKVQHGEGGGGGGGWTFTLLSSELLDDDDDDDDRVSLRTKDPQISDEFSS